MDVVQESTSPFTLRDAIHKLCKLSRRKPEPVEEIFGDLLDLSIAQLYKEKCPIFFRLALKTGQHYMMVRRNKKEENRYYYDYMVDFRFVEEGTGEFSKHGRPIIYMIDLDTEELLLETHNPNKIPNFNYYNKQREGIKASLWEIVGLHHLEGTEEPQTLERLRETMEYHGVNVNREVQITFRSDFSNMGMFIFLNLEPNTQNQDNDTGGKTKLDPMLSFYAYPTSATTIAYAYHQPMKKNYTFCLPYELPTEEDIPDPKPQTVNRRMAVSVQLTGLTLAHRLGLCTKQEMELLSCSLSRCVGAMWITFDDEKHARHVAFTAGSATNKNHESIKKHAVQLDSCEGENVQQWTDILSFVHACAQEARKEKEALLKDIFDRLEPFHAQKKRDIWCKCYIQLLGAVHKYKVFLYGFDDTSLHAIKVPVAGVFKEKQSRGVNLHILADNDICGLSTRDIDFINIDAYFNYENGKAFDPWQDDVNLWKLASDWFPVTGDDTFVPWFSPRLRHNLKSLKRYPKMFGDTSMLQYLCDRGYRNADALRQLWFQLNNLLVSAFNYDLASKGYISIAKMSFDVVWLNYALTAGPMAHGFETLHPYAEHLVRPYCTGGFSFSAKAFLHEGYGLQGEDKKDVPPAPRAEPAASVQELDLTSAYGYSGMNMSTPKGFGITFGQGMKTQRRYNLFEYRAVYYTIYKWMTSTETNRGNLISVFSNFSPLGIIFVGKYPIDLVGIFEDGSVEMVQMDGHFCHGDYERRCRSSDRYADGKTRQECEDKTRQRDEFILNWMLQVNQPNMKYSVFTDCCHPEYHPTALKRFFKTCRDPQILNLVDGLDEVNGRLDSANLNKVTFYALVEGTFALPQHLSEKPAHYFDPVFQMKKNTSNDTMAVFQNFDELPHSDDTRQILFLTSDYYRYLVDHFGFEVTAVHWVSYYKRCFDLPVIFSDLVKFRQQFPKDSTVASMLKSLVNYACGYFGLHRSKEPFVKARIAYKLPKNFNYSKHKIMDLPYFDDKEMNLISTLYPSAHLKNKSTTPLLHFVGIIEYGKMRMNMAIQILQAHLRPTAFRILYSNVDNLILACAHDTLEEALLDTSPAGIEAFHNVWLPLLGTQPGCFKQEWFVGSGRQWQFVTPFCMFYAITTPDQHDDRHKSSMFKGLVTHVTFAYALNIWKEMNFNVDIEKRTNKLVDTSTHMVTHRL